MQASLKTLFLDLNILSSQFYTYVVNATYMLYSSHGLSETLITMHVYHLYVIQMLPSDSHCILSISYITLIESLIGHLLHTVYIA